MQKVALVTGGSSGIGRSVALQLARREVGVLFTYRRQPDAARAVVAEIEAGGGTAAALPLDLATVDGLDAFVTRVRDTLEAKWGRRELDVLVNNAGMGGGTPFEKITEAEFDAMFTTNFKGPFFLTQKLLPLLADGGHIVNVSSSSARLVSVGFSAYGASKAALTAVTRSWAKELAPRRIRVNSVSPGPVVTNLADGAFAKHPEYIPMLAAQTLVGRIAEPDDVGEVIVALLSDACRHLTASDLDVSGGFMV
jgi:NAD(P)-dependent dehydrogenase (short-subunit alcohol dehydrogenase family)